MNERIRELFLEAGFHPPVVKRMGDEYKFEKFAELLIRECAEVVDNDDSSYPYDSFGHKLKQHFGVKE